jgi:putative ABC transport system permease protein
MIFGIVAIGIYVTFRTINFADLTCDGSFVTGAAVSAVLIKSGVDPYIATIASLVSGGLAGLLTGILNVKFKIADLLAGIIVAFMLYSVNLRIMNDAPSMVIIDSVTVFTNSNVSITIISLVLLFALAVICLLFSSFGLKLRSVGHNKQFSSIAGINIQLMTIAGVVISNSLVALGGGLLSQYQGFCDNPRELVHW